MAGTAESRSTAARRQLATPVPFVEYDEFVEIQIAKTRESLRSNEIITALTQLAALLTGYLLVVVILDQWVADRGLSPSVRSVMLLGLIAASGAIVFQRILWPLFRRIHPLYAARVIEQAESRFQGNLVNWIDLKEAGKAAESSGAVRAIEKRAAVGLDRMDVDTAVDRRPLMRAAYALLGVVVLSAMYVAFSPKDPFSSVRRALLPLSSTGVATETTISDITPGDVEVTARSQVTIEADLRGKSVERAQVLLTTADRKFVDQPVEMRRMETGLPRFRGVLNGENGRGLLQDVDYRIVANDAQSETFHIRVIQPPSAQIEKLTYEYPAYMRLEPRQVPGPAVDAWEGTKVSFEGRTNLPVTQARLILTDSEQGTQGEEVSLRIEDGTRFSGSWTLAFRSDGTSPRFYHVAVKTADGSIDPNPLRIPIDVRADQRPEVSLLFPTSDLEKPANGIIPLAISASDPDFQLRSLTLKSERNGSPLPDLPLFESEFPTRAIERTWEWDLGRMGLQPGERVQYWIEARDNRQPVANRTNTPRLSLLIQEPFDTDQQAQQDLAEARQQLQDDLAATQLNPGPAGAAGSEATEQPEAGETELLNKSPDPVARGAEQADGHDPQSDTNSDERPNSTHPDEQAEFQNQLERLLKREEQDRDSPDHSQTDQEQRTPAEGDGEGSRSDVDSAGDDGRAESKTPEPGTSSKPSSSRSGPEGKPSSSGESGAESSPGKAGTPGADDQTDASPQGKTKGAQPERSRTKPDSGPKGSSQGPKQPDSKRVAPEESQRSEEGNQSNGTEPRGDRPLTEDDRPRKGESPSDPSSPSSGTNQIPARQNNSPDKAVPSKEQGSGEDEQEELPAPPTDGQPGSDTDSHTAKTGKQQTKGPAPKSAPTEGEDPSRGQDAEGGEENPKSSPEEGEEPAVGETQSKKTEPPVGKRPGRPGEESRTRSQPETAGPSDSDEKTDESANQDSESRGDSQSGQAQGSQGGSEKSGKSPPSGSPRGMNSDSTKSRPSQPQSSDSSDQEPAGSKPSAASGKSPSQRTEKQRSPKSDSASDERSENDSEETDETDAGATQRAGENASDAQSGQSESSRGPSRAQQKSGTRSGNSSGESSPPEDEPASQGKQPGESLEHDDPPSEREGSQTAPKKSNKRPNNPSEVGNQTPKGQGRPQGQQSQQPSAGERGRSSSSDQGDSGGNQEGAGESTSEPGDSQPTDAQTGQSKTSPGAGRKTPGKGQSGGADSRSEPSRQTNSDKQHGSRPGAAQSGSEAGDQSSEESGETSDDSPNSSDSPSGKPRGSSGKTKGRSEAAEGHSPGSPGDQGRNSETGKPSSAAPGGRTAEGPPGSQPSQGGTTTGPASGNPGQSGTGRTGDGSNRTKPDSQGAPSERGRGVPEGAGQGEGAEGDGGVGSGQPPASDEQKLEQLKEASNLILQRLKGQLSRGDVDEETLQDLGWKDLGQLRKFVSRLEEGLADGPEDISPEAQARRRQFEELLKSLRLDGQTELRSRGTGNDRRVDQVDVGRRPVPSALRERYEAYTRSLSKPGSSGKGAVKPAPPPAAGGSGR